jgi:hypothetical protein
MLRCDSGSFGRGDHFHFLVSFVCFLFLAIVMPCMIDVAFALIGRSVSLWRSVRQIEEELREQQHEKRSNETHSDVTNPGLKRMMDELKYLGNVPQKTSTVTQIIGHFVRKS